MDINGRNIRDQMTTATQQNESNLNKQDAILKSINDRLENANLLITAGNSVTAKLTDALRLDWLRKLGTELKGYMHRIIAMNIATYHAVISIQSALPGRLERGLIEEPFILEDAIGRIAPVHLQFVTSWDAFNAVLQIRFREMQGFEKVKQKQYGLQDKASKRDIEDSRPWQRAFLPGQRIEMSFLFDTRENENNANAAVCPGCQTPSTEPTDAEVQCGSCNMWFRRIIIVQDVEPPPQIPAPTPWRSRPEFGRPGFTGMVSGPVRPGKKRVAPTDIDGEDDLREFKRVRLVMRKQRARIQAFKRRKEGQAFRTFSTISSVAKSESLTEIWKFHQGEQMLSAKVQITKSTDEIVGPQALATNQSIDPVEIVKEELCKAREAGLISKAILAADSCQTDSTENHVTTHRATGLSSLLTPENGDLPRPQSEGLPSLEDNVDSSSYEVPVEWLDFSTPMLELYSESFYHLDPGWVTTEELETARSGLAIAVARKFTQTGKATSGSTEQPRAVQPSGSVWPIYPLSIYASTGRLLDVSEIDWDMLASAEAAYGTPFRLPNTNTVFYGASIGRWIFDWTFRFCNKEASLNTAQDVWGSIYNLERNLFILIPSQYGWGRDGIWSVSVAADLNFSHFIVGYRCFWWYLLEVMTMVRMPDQQRFDGIASSNVEAYAKAFIEKFFVVTSSGVDGLHETAVWILNVCLKYLGAGLHELKDQGVQISVS
jgi:hypothetical protein